MSRRSLRIAGIEPDVRRSLRLAGLDPLQPEPVEFETEPYDYAIIEEAKREARAEIYRRADAAAARYEAMYYRAPLDRGYVNEEHQDIYRRANAAAAMYEALYFI